MGTRDAGVSQQPIFITKGDGKMKFFKGEILEILDSESNNLRASLKDTKSKEDIAYTRAKIKECLYIKKLISDLKG